MSSPYERVMIDYNFVSKSSDLDHINMFGHGVFETMRIFKCNAPLLSYHVERLHKHSKRIYIQTDIQDLRERVTYFLSKLRPTCSQRGVLRLTVASGGSAGGYRVERACKPNCIISYRSLPTEHKSSSSKGMKMRVCDYRLPRNPFLSGIKHLNRLDQILARSEWDEQFDDGIMLDQDDSVVETTFGNIFFRSPNGWVTPLIDECGIEGVMRSLIVKKIMPMMAESIDIRKVELYEIKDCSEWFVCNAVRGILPVGFLSPNISWSIGENTKKLRRALSRLYPCYI